MANELAKKAGVQRKKMVFSSLQAESDEETKAEKILGRSESTRFRRAFDRADVSGDGELTAADAVRAYRELGSKASEPEVGNNNTSIFSIESRLVSIVHHTVYFASFVKAYAWIFYNDRGGDSDSSEDVTDESISSASDRKQKRGRSSSRNAPRADARRKSGSDPKSRKLGYGLAGRRNRGGRRGGGGKYESGGGIGEEAELRRWGKRLGEKQMRRLERTFYEWAVEDRHGDGATVEVRDLDRCFRELGKKDVPPSELRAWCEEADLTPADTLSLADFAYAYHAMFVDAGGRDPSEPRERMSPFSSRASRGLAPAAGNGLVLSSQGAGRRLDGGLLSVAEVAAAMFQACKWEGTAEQHEDLIRRVSIGRSSEQAAMLARGRDVFEELDEDRDGEIPRKLIGKFLAKVGRDPKTCAAQIVSFCHGGTLSGAAAVSKARDKPPDNTKVKGRHGQGQRSKRSGRASDDDANDNSAEERKASRETKAETAMNKTDRRGRTHHQQRVAFAADDDEVGGSRGGVTTSSTVSFAEILAAFGFVFEGVGAAVKPSVAEAFAMLRLHALPAEARAAGEAAKRYVDNVISQPGDATFWRINVKNDVFFAKVCRQLRRKELLAAVGFSDELRAEAGQRGTSKDKENGGRAHPGNFEADATEAAARAGSGERVERKEWLVLEGTVGPTGKSIKAVGAAQLKILRAAREEVDAELLALEGTPSVSAALRALRESPSSPDTPAPPAAVRAAAELLLAYVTNALRDPRNPRVHRVRSGNPVFQRALGRLGGCEGAMTAVGFEPRDRGAVFVLREVGTGATGSSGGRAGTGKEREEVGTANFRFPALDPATEAFLWRRKADLEAAIEAMPATAATAVAAAPQSAPGRAAADLQDSRTLARGAAGGTGAASGASSVETTTIRAIEKRRSSTAEPVSRRGSHGLLHRGQSSGRAESEGRTAGRRGSRVRGRRAGSRGGEFGGMENVGAVAATALLAAAKSRGSAAASGARGLQLAMIREAFARLDMDGDGYISPADLGLAFRNMGRDASDRSVLAWIRRRDICQDGRVSLDEFVASFQALIPQDTPGWAVASSSVTAATGGRVSTVSKRHRGVVAATKAGINDAPMEDGASEVAAAFGRIRLAGSPAECRGAAEFALDYCRRVRDSPSAPLHWRVPLKSKRFASAVGRLHGGIELMQAIGLRLEENGTVLALWEDTRSGQTIPPGKWDRVPDSILQRLDTAAKELAAQVRGIDHPEVADLAAVSAAVARLRDSTGSAGPHLRCIEAATKYLGNALRDPTKGKFRVINVSNPVFLRDVVSVQGGVELMVALGFRGDADGHLVLPMDTDLTHLAARKLELDAGLSFLRAADAATSTQKPNPPNKGGIAGPSKSGAQRERSTVATPLSARRSGHQTLPTPRGRSSERSGQPALATPRRRSESPARTAAAQARMMNESLNKEVQSRRAAQVALGKRDREVERLQGLVSAYQEKEDSTLPIRDALTLARMQGRERAAVSQLTSEMGLDMTNATKALAWANNVNKRLALTADHEPSAAAAVAAETRGRRPSHDSTSAGQGPRRNSRPIAPSVGGAVTRLLAAVTAGTAVLEVARPEIFRSGCKIVLGSGASVGQEGRFVTAVSGRPDAGEAGGGGYVVLEMPVKLDHAEGTRVVNGRPGRAEAAAYRKRQARNMQQVVSMVKNAFLYPIVDTAVGLGENVLSARMSQKAFERRSVHKYTFTVMPLRGGETHTANHGRDGAGSTVCGGRSSGSGRGICVFPELGQVVSVSGKSTLVSQREALSLQYLRRSFLRIGREAVQGEITTSDFRAELRNNPVLAAALILPGENRIGNPSQGEEDGPGASAIREIFRRRRCRHHNRMLNRERSGSSGGQQSRLDHRSEDAVAEANLESDFHKEKRGQEQQERRANNSITWPEFVSAFVPLDRWDWEEDDDTAEKEKGQGDHAAEQRQGAEGQERREGADNGGGRKGEPRFGSHISPKQRGSGTIGGEASQGGMVDKQDLQLLKVAFAITVGVGHSGEKGFGAGAMVSLAELRAASAALDGEEPPEEPVRQALGIDAGRRKVGHAPDEKDARERYSFRDFVLLRAVLAREAVARDDGDGGGGWSDGSGFVSGWKLSALAHLRRIFLEIVDDQRSESADADAVTTTPGAVPHTAEVSADVFVSRAVADPGIVRFLGMRVTTPATALGHGEHGECSSNGGESDGGMKLREALREFAANRGGGRQGGRSKTEKIGLSSRRVRWDDIEGLLFDSYDPTELLGNPACTGSVSSSAGSAGTGGVRHDEEEVYELATNAEAKTIYALMTDGEIRAYDAAGPLAGGGGGGGGARAPLWASQAITHDPSPRALGTEGRGEHRQWRERVGLDVRTGPGGRSNTAADARLQCKNGARRLLRLHPRAKILFPCPGTGLLLVNSSAGDRCVRFHETAALRRICRTRLDLPPPPRWAATDGLGVFDAMAVLEGDGGGEARNGIDDGRHGGARSGIGTTECSLLDLVFLTELSVLLGLVGGRAEVHAFCTETGLLLAILAGHTLPISCMLWIPSQLMLATGSADTTVRVWDVGMRVVPHADEWTRVKKHFSFPSGNVSKVEEQAGHNNSHHQRQDRPSVAPDIASLEDTLVHRKDDGKISPAVSKKAPDQMASAEHASESPAEEMVASKENARSALRSLRPEILRQAKACPTWRAGRVTAVLDLTGTAGVLDHQRGATSGKISTAEPLIEVTYDDGGIELGVDPRRLRAPEEDFHRTATKSNIRDGRNCAAEEVGRGWERRHVRPAIGVRVAVHGFCETQPCQLVLDLLVEGKLYRRVSFIPAPPTWQDIMAALEAVRGRAACAVASAGDSIDTTNNDHLDNECLASPAALEAALGATDVSDENLRGLARALAEEATTAFSSCQLLRLRPEHATLADNRRGVLMAWTAIARALVTPLWPPPPLSDSWVSGNNSGGGIQLLHRWNGLRSPVPCKHLLSAGCRTPVTCLSYLPLSMLLISGYSDGRVRLWDPCARRHKLAPPPPPPPLRAQGRGGLEGQSRYRKSDGGRGRGGGRHLRLFPGVYAATAEEWTEKGETFGCVATFYAVPRTKASGGHQDGSAGGEGGGLLRVQALDSIVIPGGGATSLVVCDTESVRAAQAMDGDEPWDPSAAGKGGGFFYLCRSSEVLSIPTPRGFEEHYVAIDDASFFEVSGPLRAAAEAGTNGCDGAEVAARLRDIFRMRATVLRVAYAPAVGPRSVEAMGRQMNDTGVAARPRHVLDAQFPGQRFVVFYREGDGPDRDLTEMTTPFYKDVQSPSGRATSSNGVAGDNSSAVDGSAEFLRIEVGGGGSGAGHRKPTAGTVYLWAVGRISLRVEARSFDLALGEDRRAAAGAAFIASWALTMQHLRGLCSARAAAARDRANAEAKLMKRVSFGLRLCSLDRACGEEVAGTVGNEALRQAVAAALCLPSRFPSHSSPSSADRHRPGVYLQAAKVLHSLTVSGRQQAERGGGAKAGPRPSILLQNLEQAASLASLDPIARHFLRPIMAPAFEEALAGAEPRENRNIERKIQWNGLRAALNAAAAHPQQQATTEEAFTLLVRFGQAPPCGTVLESFVRNAEQVEATRLDAALVVGKRRAIHDVAYSGDEAPVTTPVREEAGAADNRDEVGNDFWRSIGQRHDGGGELGQSDREDIAQALEKSQGIEASSVLLGAAEIAALATNLDPMRRVYRAFTGVAEAFGGKDALPLVPVGTSDGGSLDGGCPGPYYRSPLHSYAVARRCRRWKDGLETVGDHLATTRRRLGRRGQDLLLADSRLATSRKAKSPSLPVLSADELIAQAEAVRSMVARRQQADSGGGGGGENERESRGISTVRIKRHVPLRDRSGRGVRAFEGQGYHGCREEVSRREDLGESVVVLEVSPPPLSGKSITDNGDAGGSTAIGKHLAFVASVLSIRHLRDHAGLMKFHPGAVVVEDGESTKRSSTADGMSGEERSDSTNGTTLPVRVVCERLEGWRPLSDVIREHGPLATPSDIAAGDCSDGLRVLRLWGQQLASALECLASSSLVLRDLRTSTVFVSPDGSAIKIVAFSSMATFPPDSGSLSSKAPALDRDIHNPSAPITPPEALTTAKECDRTRVSDKSQGLVLNQQVGRPRRASLLLANSGKPGAFPTTAAWDVWTLGVLLFELAFGRPPPAYGDALRQGLSTWSSDDPTAIDVHTVPDLAELASAIHFDFLSGISSHKKGGEKGIGLATSDADRSPLEKALRCASLGAAIGGRDLLRVVSSIGEREASSATGDYSGLQSVERFRRAWVRQQLQLEKNGETSVTTWQEFKEKVRAHLEVSVASATSAATTPLAWQVIGGGDESGGRGRIDSIDRGQGVAATRSSSEEENRAAAAAETAILRTAARLYEADSRGTGRIPLSVTRGVLRDELQLSFSTSEAKVLAFCLRDAGDPEGGVGGEHRGRDPDDRGNKNEDEDILYLPLLHVLRAASPSPPAGPSHGGDDPSSPPTPTSFVEVLCACLEPNPQRRSSPACLLGLPFFSPDGARFTNGDSGLKAASAYLAGTGNELSPTLALHERVENRIQTLEAASSPGTASTSPAASHDENRNASSGLDDPRRARSKGDREVATNLGAGMLVEALKELERLVHRSSTAAHHLADDDNRGQTRRIARGHAKLIGEIFESSVLLRATALALKFLDREEAETVGRGISGVGFVEGDPSKTVGARVLLALARVLEGLLLDLSRPGSAVRPYTDVVLRCLVTLFLGEEGFLPVRYGHIGLPRFGRPGAAARSSSSSSMIVHGGGRSCWRPAVSQIFEGLLVEAVGETGEGGFPYPAIQRYLRRCGSATHWIGAGAVYSSAGGDNLDGLRDNGDGIDGGNDFDEHPSGDGAFAGAQAPCGVLRSQRCPMFVRAPVYFAELLALGRVLYAFHRSSGTRGAAKSGGRTGANSRARRQATGYCLTVVRLCCDASNGGLDKAEPHGWMGGGRELDEDAAVLQRAQLLVDVRLGEKLAPCLHDSDPDVKRDAVSCALSALRGGHARLRWISLSVREAEGVDPRALLALGFCSTVWVSALVAMVSGRGASPAVGSANPSRSTRESEEKASEMALECLGYMAAAGDLATHNWRGLRVLSALQGLLNRGSTSGMGEPTTWRGTAGRSSGTGSYVEERAPESNGWNGGVLKVLQSLAENGSGETRSMLQAQSGLSGLLRGPRSTPNWESLLSPKGLVSTAVELLKGAGTLNEIICLVRRVRSTLATAVRIGDRNVLGTLPRGANTGIPEDVGAALSLVWGWMQRTLVQLARDDSDHPSTAARVSLAWECLGLMRFLLGSASACRLVRCEIHPDLAAEVSRASGVEGHSATSRLSDNDRSGRAATTAAASSDLARARTGLETLVLLSSVGAPTVDLYRVHPIPHLSAGAADALADALTYGDQETIDAVENLGLGVRLGLAVEASTRLVRESRRLGVEDVHLLHTYPAGRRARVKLLDRVLCQRGRSGSGSGLHAQVIVSGLVEFITSNMLPDPTTTDIVNVRLPASFVRHNGTPLVRNEGVSLLERVVARRVGCPSVAREAARQAVRHNVPSVECTRLRENRHRSVRVGVSACLRCLARLDNPVVDRALELAGVPRRAITSARRDHAASKTRRRWARWVRQKSVDAGERPPASSLRRGPSRRDGPLDGPSPVTPVEVDTLPREDPEPSTRHARDLGGVLGPMQQKPKALPAPTTPKDRGVIGAHHRDNRVLSSSTAGTFSKNIGGANDAFGRSSAALIETVAPATETKMSVILTIEGDLSTLSVPSVVALLAAELAAVEESIRVIEIGGGDGVGESRGDRGSSAAGSRSTSVGNRSTLKLSLPGTLASQLYTRCLAGVLRVPGLLYLEVEGKGKLKWNGEEIVPDNTDHLRLQPERPRPSSRFSLEEDPQPFPLSYTAKAFAITVPQSEHGFDTPATAKSKTSPAEDNDGIAKSIQEERKRSPKRNRGGDMPSDKTSSWLGRSASVSDRRGSRLDGIAVLHEAGQTSDLSRTASPAAALSPREQRARVAIALDRMGTAVVEVREAFQLWVPSAGQAAQSARPPTSPARRTRKRTVSFSDSKTTEAAAPGDIKAHPANVKEAMVRALTELRLPLETAEAFCDGVGVQQETGEDPRVSVTFSDFVGRYAAASGLLREASSADRKRSGDVWVEGSGGAWVAISRKECKVAKKVFDEEVVGTNPGRDTKEESDDEVFYSEKSLDRDGAITSVKRLPPETVDDTTVEHYFKDRSRTIDELYGGSVSFQEFLRAVVHLKPTALSLDTADLRTDPVDAESPPTADTETPSPRGYFDGMPGRRLGGNGGDLERRPRSSSSGEHPRSAPPAYPGPRREDSPNNRAATAARDRHEGGFPVVGPATAAALRFEREAREERRAWARRAGIGRTTRAPATAIATKQNPPPFPGVSPQRRERGRSRTRSSGPSTTSTNVVSDRTNSEESRLVYRPEFMQNSVGDSKNPTVLQTNLASAADNTDEVPVGDVVSLAFERYARDRERDRDGSTRVGQQSPRRPAPSAPFASSVLSVDASESDGTPAAGSGDAYRSPAHHHGRQNERSRKISDAEMRPSELYRDGSLETDTFKQATEVTSGDEGGGRSRRGSFAQSVPDEWKKWTTGDDAAELRGRRRGGDTYGADSDYESPGEGDDDEGAVISGPERERAFRKAFEMYDLNGDGYITYLELKAAFEQRGLSASDSDVREWIRQRDTSGTGAVDFADFSRAFTFSSN
ncbi:unnamed protein product [Scytosiphon promiscuus]